MTKSKADRAKKGNVRARTKSCLPRAQTKSGKRSYNSYQYWDKRYQRQIGKANFEKQASKEEGVEQQKTIDNDADEQDQDDITDEWYFDFDQIKPLLDCFVPGVQKLKHSGSVLDVGCGMSKIFEYLRNDGWEGKMVIPVRVRLYIHFLLCFPGTFRNSIWL